MQYRALCLLWKVGSGVVLDCPHLMVGGRDLFVVKFSFIQDQVSKVFDGILVYVFHEVFGVSFGDFYTYYLFHGVFMYSSSDSNCNDNEGVCFPTIIL